MTRPTLRRTLGVGAPLAASVAALFLASCAAPPPKNASPPIRSISRQPAPNPSQLPIVRSEPIAPDPDKALQNYRELLKLAPDDDTRNEAMRRQADLQLQVEDAKGNTDPAVINKSIQTYNQLLSQRPGAPDNDRVLYQLARGYQNIGQTDQAIATLRRLAQEYPKSSLIGDARFRRAELLYNLGRYDQAEADYEFVLGLGTGASFYQSAQYKYGWSLYKQDKYNQCLPVFFTILERELPQGELEDPDAALAAVAKEKLDLASSSLRVSSLSFAALGGGGSINAYFKKSGREPRFYPLVYNALGDLFVEKRRFSDAALTYSAFIERYPMHPSAPKFQLGVIKAYGEGGFNDLVVREKERYVTAYEISSAYWNGRAPTPEVLAELRKSMEDLGRHYQAMAQAGTAPGNAANFVKASGWYKKILDNFPNDPKIADINLLYADALYDGGRTSDAAEQYLKTAYGYGNHGKAQEAAYAAVQALQRLAKEVSAAERPKALRKSIDASLKLADTFNNHPQWTVAVTRAAQDLYEIKATDEAVTVAERLIARTPPATAEQRKIAFGVVADARFAQGRYPEAEAAYGRLLALLPANATDRKLVVEQLAASIYKQGEAAREAGNLRGAADAFLRVGTVVPDASIRPNADFDAASAYLKLEDWPKATATLESFRNRYPTHALAGDVDKQLAAAYQKDGKPAEAAGALQRIAVRPGEPADTRRESAWLAATLYDEARQKPQAAKAYEFYIVNFPQPIERGISGRRRLADYAQETRDRGRYLYWLRELVKADETAGSLRTDVSKQAGAQAALELGLAAAQDARGIRLTLPVEKSLPARKAATEAAVQALNRVSGYGFADSATAATYELGVVYRDFSRALVDSERPRGLKPEELDQYNLLIEEQADPFDQKAIEAHEVNLKRVKQNVWNKSIAASVKALGELAPAKYGKRETREDSYESLR
ncbi:MAG: tetratricopeptide repeat protein [Gammaproteobacteria bacterium]|nr:tetratricopeptide repeat protein [Gammaproteobacteria bacterium]